MRNMVKLCLRFIPIKLVDSFSNFAMTRLGCPSIKVARLKGGLQ